MSSHDLEPDTRAAGQGRLRYLTDGDGPPLVLLHTARTQAEHFRHVAPLVMDRYTVYALDLPDMGWSEIVPGASYEEPALREGVKRLLTQLDLRDVTLLGESLVAVLALTAAADLPDRVRRVVSVNPYDYRGGIARTSLLARFIISGVIAPVVGPLLATQEPKPVMRAILCAQDWSRRSDRAANQRLPPNARFTEIPDVGQFLALEQPHLVAGLLTGA